jgi:hypothetical protein
MPWKNPSQISFGLGLIKTSKSIEITLNFNLKPGKKKKKKKLVTIDDKLVTHPNFNDKLVTVDHGAITTSGKI